jgi:hypothetical protein
MRQFMEIDQILIEIASVDQVFADKISQIVAKEKIGFEKVRRNLAILRGLNTDSLASEALTKYQTPSKIIQVIELLRNSLILVPISLTWLSLAYSVSFFAKQPSSDFSPFLILWEQGFGGQLPEYLRFSQVAMIDASLVGLIILFTIIVNVKIHIFDENALTRALLLKQNVNNLLMEIEENLYKKYAALAPTEEKNLDAIVAQFDKLASGVETQNRSLLNYVAAEQERLSRLSEVQLGNAKELQNAATTFYQASSIIIDATREMNKELHSWNILNEKNISLLDQNTSHIIKSFEKVTELANILEVIRATVEKLNIEQNNSITEVNTSLGSLNETLSNSMHSLELSRNTIVDAFSSQPVQPIPSFAAETKILSFSGISAEDAISKSTLQSILAYSSFIPILGLGFGSVSLAWSFAEKTKTNFIYMGLGGLTFNVILTAIIIVAFK